jgi:hypothetical protein
MLPVVKLATGSIELGKQARDELKVDTAEKKEFASWLGRRRMVHGEAATNAFAVWDMII